MSELEEQIQKLQHDLPVISLDYPTLSKRVGEIVGLLDGYVCISKKQLEDLKQKRPTWESVRKRYPAASSSGLRNQFWKEYDDWFMEFDKLGKE